MPTRKSIIMMTSTGRNMNVIGKPVRADGYFSFTDGLHTVQVVYDNFVGSFSLQGTLALNPTEEDWFYLDLLIPGCAPNKEIIYPRDPLAPSLEGQNGDSGTDAFTFVGNFVFLRAIMSRDHLEPPPSSSDRLGQIQKVLLAL